MRILSYILVIVLAYMAGYATAPNHEPEATRARAQVALYYCIASDMEGIIKKYDPEWYWWDSFERPAVDCEKVFDYWYASNNQPVEMTWLDMAP